MGRLPGRWLYLWDGCPVAWLDPTNSTTPRCAFENGPSHLGGTASSSAAPKHSTHPSPPLAHLAGTSSSAPPKHSTTPWHAPKDSTTPRRASKNSTALGHKNSPPGAPGRYVVECCPAQQSLLLVSESGQVEHRLQRGGQVPHGAAQGGTGGKGDEGDGAAGPA
eukprot:scaffold28369_cov101-Isochrysis_galbana.AAC.1